MKAHPATQSSAAKVTLCSPVLKYGFSQQHCRVCDRDLAFIPRNMRVCPGRPKVSTPDSIDDIVIVPQGQRSPEIRIQVYDSSETNSLSSGDTSDEGDDTAQAGRKSATAAVATAKTIATIP